jgi:hypothetical protein
MLSLTTLSTFLSPCSLSFFCRRRNHRATTTNYCPRSRPRSTPSAHPQLHSTPPPRPWPWSMPPWSSSSSCMCAGLGHCRATAVNLDPASLRARRRHQPQPHLPRVRCHRSLPQALDMTFGEGDTPPLPHYHYCVNVNEI